MLHIVHLKRSVTMVPIVSCLKTIIDIDFLLLVSGEEFKLSLWIRAGGFHNRNFLHSVHIGSQTGIPAGNGEEKL